MKVSFMRLPGNGEKTLDFPGESWVTVEKVLRQASTAYNVPNIAIGNEITVNGDTVSPKDYSERPVYAGDTVVAAGTVKGAA